jgi:hypothetical protein
MRMPGENDQEILNAEVAEDAKQLTSECRFGERSVLRAYPAPAQ